MAMLLLIPAVALAFSALGSSIKGFAALRGRRAALELPQQVFWGLTTGAGAAALVLMATGRPA